MAKKMSSEKNSNNAIKVMKGLSLIAGAALLTVAAFFYREMILENEAEPVKTSESVLTAEVEYVEDAPAMAEGSSDSEDGSKKSIKIVEVIPHPICSIFPYMVDWGTVKDYNDNLLIGYEGLRYYAFTANTYDSRMGAITRDGVVEQMEELYDYNVAFKNYYKEALGDYTKEWWREYNNINLTSNGYFEYVGPGKGLYDINLDEVVEKESDSYGIRYEMTAMNRKGSESPKGEYTVDKQICFAAKDYSFKLPSTEIKNRTEYNYNLSFSSESTGEKNYRIYKVSDNASTDTSLSFDYDARLKTGESWDYGYEFKEDGNYTPKTITPVTASRITDDDYTGYYLRIESSNKRDNAAVGVRGYFKLYDSKDKIDSTTVLYQVTFEPTDSQGFYTLSTAGVMKEIEGASQSSLPGEVYSKILFDYKGKGKGNYDVSFIYAPDGGVGSTEYAGLKYAAKIEEVCFKAGRYAITSSVEDKNELYISGTGDYSKLVTRIDCRGIDYDKDSTGRTYDDSSPNGLSMGLSESNEEKGSWVFHAIKADESNGITKVENLKSTQRIYVYGQNRKKCYYSCNGFSNNEWFKLLMYLTDESATQPLALADYQSGVLSAKEIKEKYTASKDIESFNQKYKIDIVQKTPGQLTVSDVEEADLIFVSNTVSLPGMSGDVWNTIASQYRSGLPTFDYSNLSFTDDFSPQVLFAIYKCCMYDQTTALMFDGDGLVKEPAQTNIQKMVMLLDLFEKPSYFAYFIDGYDEKNEDYSSINPNTAEVTVYPQNGYYNLGKTWIKWNSSYEEGKEIEPQVENDWSKMYFLVYDLIETEWGGLATYGDALYGGNWEFPWGGRTFRNQAVGEDWTWYLPQHTADGFWGYANTQNIWKILHNKKSKETSEPVVVVTNADGSNISNLSNIMPVYYFYVDAYSVGADSNSDFDIDFRINWMPEEITEPNALQSVVVERDGGGETVFSLSNPSYKTKYTCNVAGDFIKDGALDPAVTSKDYMITATDIEGKTDSVIVRFIVREAFMLN